MPTYSFEKIWDFLTNSEVVKNGIPIVRLLIAISSLATAHLFGYIDRLGIGVGTFIGIEIAGDLFANFASSFLFAVIYSNMVALPILISSGFFRLREKQHTSQETERTAWSDLKPTWLFIALFLVIFPYNYIGNASFSMVLNYAVVSIDLVLFSLLTTCGSLLLWKVSGVRPKFLTSSVIILLLTLSYYTGELKAGVIPEFRLMQVVFADDTRLDGYPLHRVSDGFIFRKSKYFAFDVGTVFIPYSSVKMVTEPSVDSQGGHILSDDYNGTTQKPSIQPTQKPAVTQRGKPGNEDN